MIQYIKFGQNPSSGSRDMVQTSFVVLFWSKFDIQSASVTLKIRSVHFFPMSYWGFYVSLVKIHQLVLEIECRQGSFLQSLLAGIHHLVQKIECRQIVLAKIWHSKCWCDLENEVNVTKIWSFLFHVPGVFLWKFSSKATIWSRK